MIVFICHLENFFYFLVILLVSALVISKHGEEGEEDKGGNIA